jgi:hypothetical protein
VELLGRLAFNKSHWQRSARCNQLQSADAIRGAVLLAAETLNKEFLFLLLSRTRRSRPEGEEFNAELFRTPRA